MPVTQELLDQLLSVLQGAPLTREQASQLLQDAEGSVETAVGIYFSGLANPPTEAGGGAGAGPSSAPLAHARAASPPSTSKEQQVLAVLGTQVSISRARALLRASGWDVQGAIERHFEQAGSGGSSGAGGEAAGGSGADAVVMDLTPGGWFWVANCAGGGCG